MESHFNTVQTKCSKVYNANAHRAHPRKLLARYPPPPPRVELPASLTHIHRSPQQFRRRTELAHAPLTDTKQNKTKQNKTRTPS